MSELKNRIEAILFASGKGVSESDLADYCDTKISPVKKALKKLQEDYEKRDSSLTITNVDDKWKLTIIGKYTLDVQKIVSETELPKPILKTLALIAYKSPVMQSDIVHMRGQSAYEHIKVIVKQKLITKEESGRTYILKISDKFYKYFDVEGDDDIREMFEKLRKNHEEKIGELEVINLEEKNREEKEHLGKLDIVNIEPKKAFRSEEELKEEENFLKRMDEGLDVVSKKVEKYNLPERHTHPELENEQKTIDHMTTSIEEVKENMSKEKDEKKLTPLEELEQIAKDVEEEEEEKYL